MSKPYEYDDGEMTQEDWDDLVERMHSQNSGYVPTEEDKKVIEERWKQVEEYGRKKYGKQKD